jgi:hypothetical protein
LGDDGGVGGQGANVEAKPMKVVLLFKLVEDRPNCVEGDGRYLRLIRFQAEGGDADDVTIGGDKGRTTLAGVDGGIDLDGC